MITILRKHHRWLMIVIAILAVPFVFYFNKTDFGAQRSTDLGRIYDRPVTQVEYTRNARLMNLSRGLGLSLGNDLMMANVASENEMYVEFTWNRLVLLHEAERLGIRPNSSEIATSSRRCRVFRMKEASAVVSMTNLLQRCCRRWDSARPKSKRLFRINCPSTE